MNRDEIRSPALSADQIAVRQDLAKYSSEIFDNVGTQLHVLGHIIGNDRRDGASPFDHGDDATVAVAMLLKIASQLVSASADLMADGRHYAGAALIRQLVEVEYLSWAFETKSEEAAKWLRSTHEERRTFFTPAKLRKAAGERFRSIDYGHHCEMGGHPVPGSWFLLNGDVAIAQLMLSDCLGHSGRIWDHFHRWALSHLNGAPILSVSQQILERYTYWKSIDVLTTLPQPQ